MADTAIKSEEEKKEFFDPPDVLNKKVEQLAEMIMTSDRVVAFTGAGISTASGIPDYRSGFNTVLETGPGCWESAANRKKYENQSNKKAADYKTLRTGIQKAYPSKTHMALVELANRGHLKYLISQNIDGLHRKSGFDPRLMAELHGNTNLEICCKCGKEYMRDFAVRTAKTNKEHKTGRKCDDPNCGGDLKDSIINFGEPLIGSIMDGAYSESAKADCHICMGSSMRVSPANLLPIETKSNGGEFIIINLQKTPLDKSAMMCIYGKCDEVIEMLMEKLEYKIPTWKFNRTLKLEMTKDDSTIKLMGVDDHRNYFHCFPKILVTCEGTSDITYPNNTQ